MKNTETAATSPSVYNREEFRAWRREQAISNVASARRLDRAVAEAFTRERLPVAEVAVDADTGEWLSDPVETGATTTRMAWLLKTDTSKSAYMEHTSESGAELALRLRFVR